MNDTLIFILAVLTVVVGIGVLTWATNVFIQGLKGDKKDRSLRIEQIYCYIVIGILLGQVIR